MGLFDQIAGAFGAGSEGTPQSGPLVVLQALASQEGGLAGVLQKFGGAGLGYLLNPGLSRISLGRLAAF
jgi:uncharacterized protein YidB (DUF937 family)